uniref:Synaptonemal complex central element protein 2 n=1 Tax=Terrapene triunguis TaxID=2587831 RepID=A0A674JT03_9SAUR
EESLSFLALQKVSSLAEKLEEMMFLIYDRHNKQMQDKLQELSEIMERISQIQTELRQVCHTVEAAYKDLCVQPEVIVRSWGPSSQTLPFVVALLLLQLHPPLQSALLLLLLLIP